MDFLSTSIVTPSISWNYPAEKNLSNTLKLAVRTRKVLAGRLLSFWESLFSGAMLGSGSVKFPYIKALEVLGV